MRVVREPPTNIVSDIRLFFDFFFSFWLFPVFIFHALICTLGKGRGIHNGEFDSSSPSLSHRLVWSLDWQEENSFDRIRRFDVKVFSQFFFNFGLSLSSAGFGLLLLRYISLFMCSIPTFANVLASSRLLLKGARQDKE